MLYNRLHVLPLCLFGLIPITISITYIISVHWDHVMPGFPYISETGNLSPESCIFAQLLNIAALLLGGCVYVRHRQVLQWQVERGSKVVNKITVNIAAWSGALACFGLDILANFQNASAAMVHMLGAMIFFMASTTYFCMQAYLSYKMLPAINGRNIVHVRAGLSILLVILMISTIGAGYISMLQFRGNDYRTWLPSDGGWGWHIVSVISEWMLVIVECAFVLTLVQDFRTINFEEPTVTLTYLDEDKNARCASKSEDTHKES